MSFVNVDQVNGGGGGGSFTMYQTQIDFGNTPTSYGTFIIINAIVNSNSNIIVTQSGAAPTGRSADENEMDPIIFSATSGNGQFILIATSLNGPIEHNYLVNYIIG